MITGAAGLLTWAALTGGDPSHALVRVMIWCFAVLVDGVALVAWLAALRALARRAGRLTLDAR